MLVQASKPTAPPQRYRTCTHTCTHTHTCNMAPDAMKLRLKASAQEGSQLAPSQVSPSRTFRMMPDVSELRQKAGALEANLDGRFASAEGAGQGQQEGGEDGQEADSAEQEARKQQREALAEIKVRLWINYSCVQCWRI